ncbi:hypothetical protein EFP14_15345 [Lactiplantibacillus pentosus]|nr:hypothetical protein [Lactiplantibacillus pentosus]
MMVARKLHLTKCRTGRLKASWLLRTKIGVFIPQKLSYDIIAPQFWPKKKSRHAGSSFKS